MGTSEVTDALLVERAAAGSEHAFRALYRAYVRPVYWIAHGLLHDRGEAEDITQETFVVAWRKLPGLELAGDSLMPWLGTICRFQAANRIRSRRRRETDQLADAADTVDVAQQVIDRDLAARILHELEGMSQLDRDIFVLCATEGYGYQAAAEHLGVEHGVVRNRLSRVRTRLRSSLEETKA